MRKLTAFFVVLVLFVLTAFVWAQGRVYYFNGVPYRFPTVQGGSGELLTNNGTGVLTWSPAPTPEGLWAGSVVFSTVSCPTGWTVSTTAAGRYLVGMPSGGTVSGTVGTALTNLEARDHVHAGPSHQHTGPNHSHVAGAWTTSGATGTITQGWGDGSGATITLPTQGHTHTVGPFSTGDSGTGLTGAAGTANTGGASATIAPYIQFIVCVKD